MDALSQLEVTPQHVASALADEGAQIIDVREPHELETARIPGVRHIELVQLTSQAESIERDRPVIFFCHTGVRSLMAAEAFHQAGYEAYSMAGGIAAWDAAGLPTERERGAVADG